MATVTPPNTSGRLERDHTRIRHPLDRLRKYINGYVTAEAVALFGLVVTLAFWLGLWSDYGMFRVFTFDWVQSAPWTFRVVVLVGFLILLLAFVGFIAVTAESTSPYAVRMMNGVSGQCFRHSRSRSTPVDCPIRKSLITSPTGSNRCDRASCGSRAVKTSCRSIRNSLAMASRSDC